MIGIKHLFPYFFGFFITTVVCAEPLRPSFVASLQGTLVERVLPMTTYVIATGHTCQRDGGEVLQEDEAYTAEFDMCDFGVLLRLAKSGPKGFVVSDAIVLPPLRDGESIMESGECEWRGFSDQDLWVVARLGERDEIDWVTGVRSALHANVVSGKIESVPVKEVRCFRPTPP